VNGKLKDGEPGKEQEKQGATKVKNKEVEARQVMQGLVLTCQVGGNGIMWDQR